jgi:hypothetical protein
MGGYSHSLDKTFVDKGSCGSRVDNGGGGNGFLAGSRAEGEWNTEFILLPYILH